MIWTDIIGWEQHGNDPKKCSIDMFRYGNQDVANWQNLRDALQWPCIDLPSVVADIKKVKSHIAPQAIKNYSHGNTIYVVIF